MPEFLREPAEIADSSSLPSPEDHYLTVQQNAVDTIARLMIDSTILPESREAEIAGVLAAAGCTTLEGRMLRMFASASAKEDSQFSTRRS